MQLEAVVLERRLQQLQPQDLAALAGIGLVARRVHMDVTALVLRDVAGRIRGVQQVLDGGALDRHFDQAHADADAEDLVLPDEAVVVDRAHDVVGNLPGLLERAARQQDGELVAAEAADGVRIADRVLDERGDLPQHAVARDVAAFVVDGLEAVEVEVAQHVPRAAPRCFQRFLEPALELAAVHQPGEGVVARLVRHHPREATQVAHVAQRDDGTVDAAIRVAHGRHRQFDRTLAVACGRDEHAAAAEAHARSRRQALPDGVTGRLAVAFVHQLDDVAERAAEDFAGRFAHQLFAGRVDVDDAAVDVGREHALGE